MLELGGCSVRAGWLQCLTWVVAVLELGGCSVRAGWL